MTKKSKKGFTLVEMLVVIAIIGILTAIGVTALSGARVKGRDTGKVANLKQIRTALELYSNEQQSYPPGTAISLGAINETNPVCHATAPAVCKTISSTNGIYGVAAGTTYMGLIPKDPSGSTTECAHPATAPCNYSYSAFKSDGTACASGSVCTAYEITAWLEGATGGFTAGALCATEDGIGNVCP